jgi:hypothetical protein
VNRYHVVFVRADGRNTPGVDVPYPFDGGMTVTVGGNGGKAVFNLVRAQAKEEAPLRALRSTGAGGMISTIRRGDLLRLRSGRTRSERQGDTSASTSATGATRSKRRVGERLLSSQMLGC